jgi:Na+/H+ antiporter NhaD/arsenite permease-like protein
MDWALCRAGVDVESARACHDLAGNLTIVGSVAMNMIVDESAREHIEVSFWDYARFGIPITILTTAAGMILLLVLR